VPLDPPVRGCQNARAHTPGATPATLIAVSTAILFPGQGSQADGMRRAVEERCPELIERALDVVGDDPFSRAGDGTRFLQPAIYCASLAGWTSLKEDEPDFLAGHSLGELAALAAAGCLAAEDGLRLVALRGQLMQEAAERSARRGGMLALLGAGAEMATPIATRLGLIVANDNAPGQLVLSGDSEALDEAANEVRARGGRSVRLPVSGAFHSPAMAPAVPPFRAALDACDFRPTRACVYSCVTAAPFDDCRARLAESLTRPVRWRETLLALRTAGARRFVETGPGRVLSGLVRRTLPGVEALTVDSLVAGGV
jgi:[acyl-carrier-protein] S-malonyltransferase